MCGIVGVYEHGRTAGGVSERLLIAMRDTLAHRGPDGEGLFLSDDRRLGLGHRRLSIVDIHGGAQPMEGQDGAILVFNGEIYNYPELRSSLEADGAQFRTNCDTEVILHLFRRYGERCVEHMTGMFAFALWDPSLQRIFFARDHVGEKPLYWADRDGVFVFASEIKALLEHPTVPRQVNEDVLGPYLTNLVTPGPETMYQGIHKLPAGHRGRCDRDGVSIERYWSPTSPRSFVPAGDDEVRHRLRELLDASIRSRLMSDVPVGVLLSGGFDSSTIVALLSEQARGMTSFTVAFPGQEGFDEREEAKWVSRHFGTEHHEIEMTERDALEALTPLVHHQDEPLADPVCVPLHTVCRLAHETGIKVVLAGEGADEMFWGYSGYRAAIERWSRLRIMLALPRPLRRLAALATSPRRRPRRREQLDSVAAGRLNAVHMPVGMTGYQREHVLRSRLSGTGWAPSTLTAGEDPLTTLAFDTQEYEFEVRLPELLLMRIDRFSMANSVEARVPFLDRQLVDFAYRLPLEHKVRNGITKYALKQAVADVVPSRVSGRVKQGFAAPTSRWFATLHGGLLRELLEQDTLRRYFRTDYLAHILDTADHSSWETGQMLWPVLNFGLWHKYWIENESVDDLVARSELRNDPPRGAKRHDLRPAHSQAASAPMCSRLK